MFTGASLLSHRYPPFVHLAMVTGTHTACFRSHKSGSQVGDPVPEMARQGRDNQRYAGTGERLVCGCIPYVRGEEEAGPSGGCRVLVITSRGGKGWVFPKGGWELDEDVEAAAARETVEEAGVRGVLTGGLIGVFEFHSGKQERRRQADQGRCIAHMFALDVQEVSSGEPRRPCNAPSGRVMLPRLQCRLPGRRRGKGG